MRHRVLLILAAASLCGGGSAQEKPGRRSLLPKLQPGQILHYSIGIRNEVHGDVMSVIVDPQALRGTQVTVQGLLRVEVLGERAEGKKSSFQLRTIFEKLESDTRFNGPQLLENPDYQFRGKLEDMKIQFTLTPGGKIADLTGLDAFFPEQQQAWLEWFAQFGAAATFPESGVKQGERWHSEQTEGTPAILTGLEWVRKSEYVRDEACQAVRLPLQGAEQAGGAPETCAVIITTATLKQKSNPKDATPEAFRLRDLRISGTARGTTEIITYISVATGRVMRSTVTGLQEMDVTVAKTDNSNRVRYKTDTKSHSELQLVLETPLARP